MYTKAARLISYMLHPLLLPTMAFIILLYLIPMTILTIPEDARWLLLSVIFILTFLAPATGIMFLYLFGNIKNLHHQEAEERRWPLMVVSVFYIMTTVMFGISEAFSRLPILFVFAGAITLCLTLLTALSLAWKISIHSTGIGGLVGFLMGLGYRFSDERFLYPIVICVILSGILMSAQLYLNAHTPEQVMGGFALGLAIHSVAMFYFL